MNSFERQLVELYNRYRTALFNHLYYGARLSEFRSWNLALEIFLAITASSAVGGWLIWKEGEAKNIWVFLTALSAVLSIVKPIINLPEKIEKYSKLFSGHGDCYFDFDKVVSDVRNNEKFTPEILTIYDNILERRKTLGTLDDTASNSNLAKEKYDEVNKLLPVDNLWMPQ